MAIRKRITGREGFGSRLAKLRAQHGLTLAQLGDRVGVTSTCAWNWENDNTFPKQDTLATLANALDTTVDYLAYGFANDGGKLVDIEPTRRRLADIILEARQQIANEAGIDVSQVRVTLDYGD